MRISRHSRISMGVPSRLASSKSIKLFLTVQCFLMSKRYTERRKNQKYWFKRLIVLWIRRTTGTYWILGAHQILGIKIWKFKTCNCLILSPRIVPKHQAVPTPQAVWWQELHSWVAAIVMQGAMSGATSVGVAVVPAIRPMIAKSSIM